MQLEVDCMYIFPLSLLFFVQSIDLTSSFIRFFVRHDAKKPPLLFAVVVVHSIKSSSFVHSFIHSFIQHGSKNFSSCPRHYQPSLTPTSHPPPPKIYHRILNHLATIPQPHNPMLLRLLLLLIMLLKNKPPL